MDWNITIDRHREALQRIVMLLLALAALADQASVRSRRVRREVLSILSPAEVFATEAVIWEAQAARTPMLTLPAYDGDSVEDAVQLAACFRALAAALANILAQAWRFMHRNTPRDVPLSNWFSLAARQSRHAQRGLGFRALDSPKLVAG